MERCSFSANSGSCFLSFCFVLLHIQSRERLLRALRAMNAGDAAEQVIRRVDKLLRSAERSSRDVRLTKV